jgi:hypothetical protein
VVGRGGDGMRGRRCRRGGGVRGCFGEAGEVGMARGVGRVGRWKGLWLRLVIVAGV